MDNLLRHIETRITDEGLVIELFSLEGLSLFEEDTAVATPVMEDLIALVASIITIATNDVATRSFR